jgi:TPR repeat protein
MSNKVLVSVVCSLVCSIGAAQQGLPDPSEVEKRNAAAAFVAGREMSLAMLQRACSEVLKGTSSSMDQVTRQWVERNHLELEASDSWLRRYFSHLNQNDPAKAKSESALLVQGQSRAVSQAVELHFKKNVPTKESCVVAARSYGAAPLDFKNLKSSPGYEAFGEFAETLSRIRSEPGFSVRRSPGKRYEDLLADTAKRPSLALLVAADAAGDRGDERSRTAIFEQMASQGDAKAAQTVALAHYRGGGNLPQVPKQAYRWFYQAWALGDIDGLNGLGVMLNEGKAVARHPELAFAVFAVVKTGADSDAAYQRATNNLAGLDASVPDTTRRMLACASLGALDAKLESLVPVQGPPMRKRALSEPGRRLGELSKDLAPYYSRESCSKTGSSW